MAVMTRAHRASHGWRVAWGVSARVAALAALAGLLGACGTRLPATSFATTAVSSVGPAPSTAPAPNTAAARSSTTANRASDVGVTDTQIRIGVIVSKTSPLGSETFSGPMYGVRAFIAALNARGGVNGRTVDLVVCDDGATGAGNRRCASKLIDDDHVFALVGTTVFDYAGAAFVNERGVPDIGGQPINGGAYGQYPHLWSIYGTTAPRDGKTVGFNGKLYGGTEVYRYFAKTLGASVAGVVGYNQADSLSFADLTAQGLGLEGFRVVREQLDFSVPNWQAAAIDMKAKGVDIVFDSLDSTGNVKLCQAMDAAGLTVKAKAVSVQAWNESVHTDYGSAVTCRNTLYATSTSRNYMETTNKAVARFRADMRASFPEREPKLSMWELEGWGAAQWFVDAASSCVEGLTRACVETYLNTTVGYDGHGLFTPRDFVVDPNPGAPSHSCLFVAQWQDAAYGGAGGWVSRSEGGEPTCYDVPNFAYAP